MRIIRQMNQSPAQAVVDFPERGVQWVKEQLDAVLTETEQCVREKPTQSLLCAFAAGYILERLPLGRIAAGLLRLLLFALKPALLIYGVAKLYQAIREEER
jgi:hypothetical protein